ncbi:hypothetical protein DFH09DRAFT_1363690 [Mycena vulgaris]|nr:hypothetical protein DFH09DRAFT_1363690 [Mycena vulgaris]
MSSDPEAPVPTAPAPAPVRCRGLEIQIHDVDRDQSLRALELPHPFPYAAIDPRFCLIFTPEHAAAAEKIKEERERTGEFNLLIHSDAEFSSLGVERSLEKSEPGDAFKSLLFDSAFATQATVLEYVIQQAKQVLHRR